VLHREECAVLPQRLHGAEVGDLFMSLIHTLRVETRVNSFEYLVAFAAEMLPRLLAASGGSGCRGIILRQ